MKFYRIIVDGNDKKGGVLYAPSEWSYPIARDARDVENWQNLILELRDGEYYPFPPCDAGANMVSEELKNLLQSFIGNNKNIEFLPVKTISKEYGDNIYYIIHFKIIYDVIDSQKTIYVPNTNNILKIRIDSNKAKDLKVFNARPFVNDLYVSEDVYQAIRKNKLDKGIEFVLVG